MRSRFVAYATLVHFTPLVSVIAATGLLAWMIGGAALTRGELGRLVVAMLGCQILIGVANELVDAETDRLTKPSKPIPAGRVSRNGALVLGALGFTLMLAAGISLGSVSFLILLIGAVCGVAYSLWFKRTAYAWLPYLVALPLVPIWVAVALDRFEPALLLLYPLGALAVLAIQLAQSVPDVEPDRAAGIDSLTTRLGEQRTLVLCWASIAVSLVLAMASAAMREGPRWSLGIAAAIVLGLLVLDIGLYRKNRRGGVMAAFPCSAASTVVLALAWVASIYR